MLQIFTNAINGTDCIGDSRLTINVNFSALDVHVQTLSSRIFSLTGGQQAQDTAILNLQTNVQSISTYTTSSIPVLSTSIQNLSAQFNTQNIGPSATLTTYVSALSVFNTTGTYLGFIPIYR